MLRRSEWYRPIALASEQTADVAEESWVESRLLNRGLGHQFRCAGLMNRSSATARLLSRASLMDVLAFNKE
jgi:hypothetical protein